MPGASFGSPLGAGSGAHVVYASWWPATGNGSPGNAAEEPAGAASLGTFRHNTENAMVKARQSLFGMILENWLPFTATVVARFIGPRAQTQPWQSPYDVDGSERIVRPGPWPSASRPFPYPYEIGAVSGFLPMLDQYSLAWAWGKTPSGPGVLTPVPIPFQASYPNLQKVTG